MKDKNLPVLRCTNLGFAYPASPQSRSVLREVELSLATREKVAIVGESGSGKSTLLHLIAGLERPTSGDVYIAEMHLNALSERARTAFRGQQLGVVFQAFYLIPTLTAQENVALTLELTGKATDAYARAADKLQQVGLGDKLVRYPEQLSGGEQQRVAIARALVHEPLLILADEPTGNLDSKTGEELDSSIDKGDF